MHAYEAHLRATGQPVSHGKMKVSEYLFIVTIPHSLDPET